jgi:hypothetical protein
MAHSTIINTKHVSNRRVLHFENLDAVLADVEALAGADQQGKLHCLGNWTFGQTLGHLAGWVDYSFVGTPLKIQFYVRWMLRPMKRRFLYTPMRVGGNIPKVPGGTLATDVLSAQEGLARFRHNFLRLQSESPKSPHVVFGPLTHDEWINMHLRHSELHLSFLRAD